jgi:hypothetical protein
MELREREKEKRMMWQYHIPQDVKADDIRMYVEKWEMGDKGVRESI